MLDRLTRDDFAARLHQTFRICPPGLDPLEVELISASSWGKPDPLSRGRQPFSIVLRSLIRDRYLPQHIYPVEHDDLGRLELFLVPIGPDEVGMRYEAVFS